MENFSPNERQLRGMGKGGKKWRVFLVFLPHGKYSFHTSKYSTIAFFEAQKCNYAYPHTALRKAELTL